MVQDGKNEPFLRELYKEKVGKEALKKDGTQSQAYLDWKLASFTPMKPSLLKYFGGCTADIDAGKMSANECYDTSYLKTVENGSVYISPALRRTRKETEFQSKYDLKALEEAFKKKYGIK